MSKYTKKSSALPAKGGAFAPGFSLPDDSGDDVVADEDSGDDDGMPNNVAARNKKSINLLDSDSSDSSSDDSSVEKSGDDTNAALKQFQQDVFDEDSDEESGPNELNNDYTKDLTMKEIEELTLNGVVDTAQLLRVDEDEPEVYDLTKTNDILTLKTVIENDGDHIIGWKLTHSHREDKNLASALVYGDIEQLSGSESNEEEDEFDAKFAGVKGNDNNSLLASSDDSDEDIFAHETPETTKLVNQQFKQSGGEILTIKVSKIMRFENNCFAVAAFGDLVWYYLCDQFTGTTKTILQSLGKPVPAVIENLKDHKLRVKHSITNEAVIRPGKSYPDTLWVTSIPLNAAFPEQHLDKQLKKLSTLFKQALTPNEYMTPGRRFVTYCENSGKDRVLAACKYMGDLAAIERKTNEELIKLGKKDHIYTKGVTLDEFWTDYSIKEFLEEHAGCSSWDDVPEDVKRICYKHYPHRRQSMPDWDGVTY